MDMGPVIPNLFQSEPPDEIIRLVSRAFEGVSVAIIRKKSA